MSISYRIGDVFARLAEIPDGSIDMVMTSPPFLALRSYLPADHPDKKFEIGSEPTPAAFLDTMLALTREWRRVLAPHGSICVELGDTYSGSGGAGGDYNTDGLRDGQEKFLGSARRKGEWPLAKSLCGIPQLYSWSLAYGRNLLNPDNTIEPWRVRNVVAWCRPNPPVGALGDKFRPATSYMTIACVGQRRYFDLDAVRVAYKEPERIGTALGHTKEPNYGEGVRSAWVNTPGRIIEDRGGAPPLDYWEIPTAPYKGSHYATYPPALCERPILAMCPQKVCTVCGKPSVRITRLDGYTDHNGVLHEAGEKWASGVNGGRGAHADKPGSRTTTTTLGWSDCGHDAWRTGVVLDPFAGSGTTLAVAQGLGRHAIGIDLDARNADLARDRVGMFMEVVG